MGKPVVDPSNEPSSGGSGTENPWGSAPVDPAVVSDPTSTTAAVVTAETKTANESARAASAATKLDPPPIVSPILLNSQQRMTPAWVMWFQQLYRRVGYGQSGSLDDAILLGSFDAGQGSAVLVQDDHSLDQVEPCRCGQVAQQVQDYLLMAEPAPSKDHTLTWNDWNLSISGAKTPAVNNPTWATLVGNLNAYQFAVNDYLYLDAQEFLHDWAEGTDVNIHLHWTTGGLNDATVRGVKWEVEYAVCNPVEGGFGATAFTSTTTVSAESSIPAAQPDRTHRISSIGVISGANLRIGAQIVMRLRRIAAVATAPAANPFALSFGLHYQADTRGSRSIATK